MGVVSSGADHRIECTDDALVIHGYYPWAKRIPYGDIRGVRQVTLSALRGKGRIWGTANFRYWANFDPGRSSKTTGLILDVGKHVQPFITPDDPDAVVAAIREHTGLEPTPDNGTSPFI
jgi:hypothetical protein